MLLTSIFFHKGANNSCNHQFNSFSFYSLYSIIYAFNYFFRYKVFLEFLFSFFFVCLFFICKVQLYSEKAPFLNSLPTFIIRMTLILSFKFNYFSNSYISSFPYILEILNIFPSFSLKFVNIY